MERCAGGLVSLGMQQGDRVGIWAPNQYEWVLTQFATAIIGVILVSLWEKNFISKNLLSKLSEILKCYTCNSYRFLPLYLLNNVTKRCRWMWTRPTNQANCNIAWKRWFNQLWFIYLSRLRPYFAKKKRNEPYLNNSVTCIRHISQKTYIFWKQYNTWIH